MKKIYLAGPDVFETDAVTIGEELKQQAQDYGFVGLFPLDNVIPDKQSPHETARAIRDANLELLKSADIVMANLNPFRGIEPDSGTVFEVGYACALGKDVYCYAADCRDMMARIREKQQLPADATMCREGKTIEDFNLSHNLMMIDLVVAKDAESCFTYIAKEQGGKIS